jgi:hypothetical protein
METVSSNFKKLVGALKQNAKLRNRLLLALAVLLVLQLYFVRELLAAELLFGLLFAVLLFMVGIFYVVGAIGEWGIGASGVGARVLMQSARRGIATIEEISKKPFRHPHSESGQ